MSFAEVLVAIPLAAYSIAIAFVCLYGANCYLWVWLYFRHKKAVLAADKETLNAWDPDDGTLPIVTIQLPLYNERLVVERLVETVTRLDYPQDRLQIQILDDSTDATTDIVRKLVGKYQAEGFDIALLHRTDRTGFKAGALKEGLRVAKGEYVAIFDADFVPDPDFLRTTLPFLQDPKVALVQTLWGHLNREYSTLTIAQSVGLDGANLIVQSARCWSDTMMQFQGTAGVWRTSAIEDAGGWHADTLTEDLDLSYRAQMNGWKMKFLPQVKCPGEIPVTMSAVKSQQHRWAKGGLQNAFKLIPAIFRSELSAFSKYQAIFHLVNYLIHPCVLTIALSWPLHIWFAGEITVAGNPAIGLFALSLCLFGPATLFITAQRELYPDWKSKIHYFIMLIVWATGLSVNNTRGVFEAILRHESPFVRTPKLRIESSASSVRHGSQRAKLNGQMIVEATLAVYCLSGVIVAAMRENMPIDPFAVIFTTGLTLVAVQSFREVFSRRPLTQDAAAKQT